MTSGRTQMLAAAAAAVVAVFPLSARAQNATQETADASTGPIVIRQQQLPEEKFRLEPPELTLDLSAAYLQNHTKGRGGFDQSYNQTILEQVLDLKTRGYIVHPNFVELNIGASVGLQEIFTDGDGGSARHIGTIYEWDISALILRNSEWPMQVFSQRQESWIFREFGSAVSYDSTSTGFNVNHRIGSTTNNLSLSHTETNQDFGDDAVDLSIVQDRLTYFGTAMLTADQLLEWNYAYNNVKESNAVDYSYQTNDLTLSHVAKFGDSRRSSLTSTFNYFDQSSAGDYQRLSLDERLYIWHSHELQTRYQYTYSQFDVAGIQRSDHHLTAGFTHRLYESLTTTGDAGIQYFDGSDSYSATQEFANINWSYRKRIPYGTLSASLGLSWSHADSGADGSDIRIIDQSATFNDPLPIVITGANIDPSTIVLTDPSGLLYRPGIDYTVTGFPDRVEIRRIIGGGIGTGQSVLVDYTRGADASNSSTTTGASTSIRYDFEQGPLNGLALYARYARQDQSIDTDSNQWFIPNEYTDTVYGAEYRIGELTLGAEQQYHDSTTYPYDASRLWGQFLRQSGDTTLSLNAAYTMLEYTAEDYGTELYTVSASVDHRFTSKLTGRATIMWRDEMNDRFGRITGFDEQLELNWKYRQLEAYLQIRASQLDSNAEESQFEFVRLGVRRQF